MDLHSLSNVPGARSRRKRLGRGTGSGLGKTSGRGHKGQYARKGHKHKLGFEGGQMPLVRRLPKRGFKNPAAVVYAPVNVAALNVFEDGAEVTREALVLLGLADRGLAGVKILGNGEITKKLTVKAQAFSASAKAKIEAAGGTCEIA
ncbi:MAG: 50S ribosomal protein L15 [Kiritimatiellia bacterium]|jgi:large subunit ribosomal protein L15